MTVSVEKPFLFLGYALGVYCLNILLRFFLFTQLEYDTLVIFNQKNEIS